MSDTEELQARLEYQLEINDLQCGALSSQNQLINLYQKSCSELHRLALFTFLTATGALAVSLVALFAWLNG